MDLRELSLSQGRKKKKKNDVRRKPNPDQCAPKTLRGRGRIEKRIFDKCDHLLPVQGGRWAVGESIWGEGVQNQANPDYHIVNISQKQDTEVFWKKKKAHH